MSDTENTLIPLPGCLARFVRLSVCPFCASADCEIMPMVQPYVKCGDCGSTGPLTWSYWEAIYAWNKRGDVIPCMQVESGEWVPMPESEPNA